MSKRKRTSTRSTTCATRKPPSVDGEVSPEKSSCARLDEEQDGFWSQIDLMCILVSYNPKALAFEKISLFNETYRKLSICSNVWVEIGIL